MPKFREKHAISIGEILARCLTGVVIIGQSCLLDYFIVSAADGYGGPQNLGWIAADLFVLICFILFNILALRYFLQANRSPQHPDQQLAVLPYAFLTWIIYSVVLAAKVATMFKTFARLLPASGYMGTNMMKMAIGSSAAVFALIIGSHHRGLASQNQKFCLKWMQTHVVFELLDTVDFLSILFIYEDQHLFLPFDIESAIIGYSCINLLVPAVSLYQLSTVNFARKKPRENFALVQTIVAAVFVNIPYLVIRLILWHTADFTTALFILKNIIAIFSAFWELRIFIPCCIRSVGHVDDDLSDSIKMEPVASKDGISPNGNRIMPQIEA